MTERTIRYNGIELATEAFGDPLEPPVLLIMGVMASMLWWPEEFCERLAARGRYVIRYDNRDTGLSTTYPVGKPSYTFDDLVDDVTRVLDGYGITTAHLVGMSMGGMIAELAVLRHPERASSLTAISTSPVGASNLPPSTDTYREHSAEGEKVDWSDRDQVVEFMVRDARMLAGTTHPHDEARARELVTRDMNRARNFASATNHFMLQGGDELPGPLSDIRVPLLVIHGTADPIFPVEHGIAFAHAVSGAKLVRLEGGGHELHEADFGKIVEAIVEHTAPGRAIERRQR